MKNPGLETRINIIIEGKSGTEKLFFSKEIKSHFESIGFKVCTEHDFWSKESFRKKRELNNIIIYEKTEDAEQQKTSLWEKRGVKQ